MSNGNPQFSPFNHMASSARQTEPTLTSAPMHYVSIIPPPLASRASMNVPIHPEKTAAIRTVF